MMISIINYILRELLYVIYKHLQAKGLKNTAEQLCKEGDIKSFIDSHDNIDSPKPSPEPKRVISQQKTIKLVGLRVINYFINSLLQ